MTIIDLTSKFIPMNAELESALNSAWSEPFTVKKKELLLKQGDICKDMYFIVSGSLEGYYIKDGKRISKWFGFEGELRTSALSYLTHVPTYDYIEVLEDSVLMKIDNATVEQLYAYFPEMERFGRLSAQYYFLWQESRAITLHFKTAKERYDDLLKFEPQILKRIPLGKIASYLGVSQETISRIRLIN